MKKVKYNGYTYWVDKRGNAYKTALHAYLGIASPSLTLGVEPMRRAENKEARSNEQH